MPHHKKLKSQVWTRFKLEQTDENRLISLAIKDLLSSVGATGSVLDVGAGVGDIAATAFPELPATLVDVLDFASHSTSPLHVRLTEDFFRFEPRGALYETVVMSHVLQYLDDDIGALLGKLAELNPRFLVTVVNEESEFLDDAVKWLESKEVRANPEVAIPGFPPRNFQESNTRDVTGKFWATDFRELAHTLATLILDAELTYGSLSEFASWLSQVLPSPQFSIHQKVKLYVNSDH